MKSYKMIQKKLKKLGISQIRFSEMIGKSQPHVSKIVNGAVIPTPKLAAKISYDLNLGNQYFMKTIFEGRQRKLQIARRHIFGPERV